MTMEHPHKETMNKLNNDHITVYRTDSDGTILAETDGNTYAITTNLKKCFLIFLKIDKQLLVYFICKKKSYKPNDVWKTNFQ